MSYWKQKDHDLDHARSSVTLGHYDWAIIAAVSAAKNAVRALLAKLKVEPKPNQEASALLKAVEAAGTSVPQNVYDFTWNLYHIDYQHPSTKSWETHEITATQQTPPSIGDHAPYELITRITARNALDMAAMIIAWVSEQL